MLVFCVLGTGIVTPGYAVAEPVAETAQPPYVFGVFPHLAVARLEKIYAPMAADFSRVLERRVYFRTKPSFEKFMAELRKQTYDIVFVQPFDYVWAHEYGYLPLARRGEPLTAQIMVEESSPLRDLKDLKGAVLALPPAEAAVSHLTKMALLDAGLNPHQHLTLQHTKSHDSCLQRLLIGAVDACGTAAGPVRFFQARMKVSFRVLGKSRTIPHALIAVHSRVPENERERLRQTIISWQDSADGRQLLARGEHKPFQVVTDAEYNVVRQYWQRLKP
jgi:phosphonate transport system substrate-binding protein